MGILKKAGQVAGGIAGNVAGLPGMVGGAIAGGKAGQAIEGAFSGSNPVNASVPAMTPAQSREARQGDWDIGYKRGQELFKEGSLGRLGTNPDMQAVLERRRAQMKGFTPQEMEMMRSNVGIASRGNLAGSLRNLQASQGVSGVRGPAASAQKLQLLGQANQAAQENERQLQLANILESRRGLDALEQSAGEIGKFDIGQVGKERFGQYSTGLGEQMLGSADRGAVSARDIAIASSQAQQSHGGKK